MMNFGVTSYTFSFPAVPPYTFPTLIRVGEEWRLTTSYPDRLDPFDIKLRMDLGSAIGTTFAQLSAPPTPDPLDTSTSSKMSIPTSTSGGESTDAT